MSSNQNSTPNKPLFFLQEFLEMSTFNSYEKDFYENEINPSMKSNKEQGYIEFTDNVYLNEDVVPRRIFFKDKVLKIIVLQKNISIKLIKDKVEQIDNLGNSSLNFISKTKHQIISLLESTAKYNKLYHEIAKILQEINIALAELNQDRFENNKTVNRNNIQSGYFAPNINVSKLGKIYEVAIELNIIDIDEVTKEDFINVFTHPNPKLIESKIVFNVDNRKAFFFLNNIKKYFNNLSPSRMSNSLSFFSKKTQNKNSIVLKQNNIDKVNNDLRKIDSSKYDDILIAIKAMEEKHKF